MIPIQRSSRLPFKSAWFGIAHIRAELLRWRHIATNECCCSCCRVYIWASELFCHSNLRIWQLAAGTILETKMCSFTSFHFLSLFLSFSFFLTTFSVFLLISHSFSNSLSLFSAHCPQLPFLDNLVLGHLGIPYFLIMVSLDFRQLDTPVSQVRMQD